MPPQHQRQWARIAFSGVACAALVAVLLAGAVLGAACVRADSAAAGSSNSLRNRQLNDVSFVDLKHGWAVGKGVILSTTDGGKHWQAKKMAGYTLNGVHFLNRKLGWAAGVGRQAISGGSRVASVVLRTTNGGKTWVPHWEPRSMSHLDGLNDVCFTDARRGCAVGNDQLRIYTTNGGRTWKGWSAPGDAADYYAVNFSHAQVGFNGGGGTGMYGACILERTGNAGKTWEACPGSAFPQWWVYGIDSLYDPATNETWVWACTDFGGVLSSGDGGDTWNKQPGPSGSYLYDIDIVDKTHGWAVGRYQHDAQYGLIWRTTTGNTWDELTLHTGPELRGVSFVTDTTGWIVGAKGIIYKTTDAGESWTKQ